MTNTVWRAGLLACALAAGTALATDFPVQGTGASGKAGDSVFVTLDYDYGAGFSAIAEDFQFEYQFSGISFMPEKSTFTAEGKAAQGMPQYMDALRVAAGNLGGNLLANPDKSSPPGFKGYAMSFYTDGRPHMRSGHVTVKLAFDILPDARPGAYLVSFIDKNVLVDEAETEYTFPVGLQQLSVAVAVPEPHVGWMLVLGLALVGLVAHRRITPRALQAC